MSGPEAPLFTVLIPTHDRADLLPRAISSVLAQTERDFELLIVDDASTDDTESVVRSNPDERLVYVQRETNGGAGAARNTGIRRARGRYIGLLDDDDEYLPQFLERTRQAMDAAPPEVGFSWCGLIWVRDTADGEVRLREELWQPSYDSREHAYLSFLENRRVGTNCGLTFRRNIFDEVGYFDEDFRGGAEDTDFLIRLVRQFDFRVVPGHLVKVHLQPTPTLRTFSRAKAEDYERIIAKNRPALESHPRLWAALHYKMGWLHLHAHDRPKGRRSLWQAIRRRPQHLRSWALLVLDTLAGERAPDLHARVSSWLSGSRPLSGQVDGEQGGG